MGHHKEVSSQCKIIHNVYYTCTKSKILLQNLQSLSFYTTEFPECAKSKILLHNVESLRLYTTECAKSKTLLHNVQSVRLHTIECVKSKIVEQTMHSSIPALRPALALRMKWMVCRHT